MMTLSATTSYAIHALTCLVSELDVYTMVGGIAERTGTPGPYLSKIIKRLSDAGIVLAKRGSKGGAKLARAPEEITLLDIVLAVEGTNYFDGCMLGNAYCSDERACPAHTFWKPTRSKIKEKLSSLTLREIAAFQERGGDLENQVNLRLSSSAKR